MQFNQTIKLSSAFIAAIISNGDDRYNLIADELERHLSDMALLLTSYHWNERAVVQAIKINRASVQIDRQGNGRFGVNYGTNIHYGCSDIDIDLEQKMTINISADLQAGGAILKGEYIPEREPDGF